MMKKAMKHSNSKAPKTLAELVLPEIPAALAQTRAEEAEFARRWAEMGHTREAEEQLLEEFSRRDAAKTKARLARARTQRESDDTAREQPRVGNSRKRAAQR
jgi:hypothetical protein